MDKYEQLEKIAEWVNENYAKVANDDMSIIIYVADDKEIRCLSCVTSPISLRAFIKVFNEQIAEFNDYSMMS